MDIHGSQRMNCYFGLLLTSPRATPETFNSCSTSRGAKAVHQHLVIVDPAGKVIVAVIISF